MKTYLHAYFDKLKTLVLKKAKITQLVPADCYRLALEIKVETNKSVSETTLKRVFGFASSIHQPSIYTLNALAEYCGFKSWNNFYTDLEQDKLQTARQRTWGEIALNATKISLFKIQLVARQLVIVLEEQRRMDKLCVPCLPQRIGPERSVDVLCQLMEFGMRKRRHARRFAGRTSVVHGKPLRVDDRIFE